MSNIETAQNTLAGLEEKLARLVEHGFKLADQRREISYDAHAIGDEAARKKLAKLHSEIVQHESEVKSLDDAIETAKLKLAQAQGTQAAEQDRHDALRQREVLTAMADAIRKIDEGFKTVVDASNLVVELNRSMRQYGWAPSDQQIDVNMSLIFKSALMQTPVRREFPHLPPYQRKTGAEYLLGAGGNPGLLEVVGSRIAARLGETEEKAA